MLAEIATESLRGTTILNPCRAAGFSNTEAYAESNDNHSWYSWQFSLIDGLRSLTRDWRALGHEINTNGSA